MANCNSDLVYIYDYYGLEFFLDRHKWFKKKGSNIWLHWSFLSPVNHLLKENKIVEAAEYESPSMFFEEH